MRKLRESERSHQIRLAPRIEEKIHHDDHVVDLCKMSEVEEEEEVSATEIDRLRELAVEQQEVIEVLRQAVKEKERKLEQLSNKRRKEEFYKQWLELEPVAEVDDEDDHQYEEGDSAMSSAPPSLSPQPSYNNNSSGNNTNNGVTREAYENVLMEMEELQTKLLEDQQELNRAKDHVQELEEALLQETRGSQNCKRALTERLRDAEDRAASLVAEISELREQNELLEFRVLELEESPILRETPDPADSGIVSPEPIHLYKEQQSKQHRAVATVIPYTSTYSPSVLSSDPHKAPLSLQESGIFEEELDEQVEDHAGSESSKISCQSTQTEAPAGELLQEVQRLQELRVRIQERASKVPPVSPVNDRKNDGPCDFPFDVVTPLRERVHELEDRLSFHESERTVHKEREEELLDENYRLTERLYCLEADLKKLKVKLEEVKLMSDAETMTDELEPDEKAAEESCDETDNKVEDAETSRCQKLYQSAIQNLDLGESSKSDANSYSLTDSSTKVPCSDCSELWLECDARIHNLARTEFCLRQQIASLEHRESAFFETLRQADATWAKLESDYESKQREMTERLDAQVELNRALFEHLTKLSKNAELPTSGKTCEEPMEVDDNVSCKSSKLDLATQTDDADDCCKCSSGASVVRTDSMASRVSTISRTSIKMSGCDEIDANVLPAEVATEAKEEMQEKTPVKVLACSSGEQEEKKESEALVSIDESSSDKKDERNQEDEKLEDLFLSCIVDSKNPARRLIRIWPEDKMAGAAWYNQATTRNGASCRKVLEAAKMSMKSYSREYNE